MSNLDSLIESDPVDLVITRHTEGSGKDPASTEELDAQRVKLYYFTTRNQRQVTVSEGVVKIAQLGILAQPDADIQAEHGSYDTFEYQGRKYRVVGVRKYNTIMSCVQADCVAV
jgi:hypothetical protein